MKIKSIYYPFYYLFYRLYKFNEYLFPKNEMDNFPLVGGVTLCQLINIYSIILLIDEFYNYKLNIGKVPFLIGIMSLLIGNSIIFLGKKRDKNIIQMFENETIKARKRGLVLTWIYIVSSYILFFYSVMVSL